MGREYYCKGETEEETTQWIFDLEFAGNIEKDKKIIK